MVKLAVTIGSMKLKNPVMVASGTFGKEYKSLVKINSLGALIMKTITLKARLGNLPPRVTETAFGMLNSIGLENKGIEDFIKNKLPSVKKFRTAVIASISADSEEEFKELARRLTRAGGIDGIELNLSCPNIKHGMRNYLIAQDEAATFEVISAVRKATCLTIMPKLAPNVTDITKIAKAAQAAGADAVVAVNTFAALAVDIETRKAVLGNVTGGLSGPAIKPVALKMVRDIYNKIKIPVIGVGGIMDCNDAIEFILCGARAVQVGTANFVNPKSAENIIGGIKKYLTKNNIDDVGKLTGRLGNQA